MATRSATALTTTIASRRRSVVGVFLLVLVYPMLLLLATGLGFRLGAGLDVSARTALARALSYAADPESRVSFSADTKRLTVVPLDTGTLRALGLGSGAVASSTPSPSSSTAAGGPTEIGGTPSSQAGALAPATAHPGTGAGGTAPPAVG